MGLLISFLSGKNFEDVYLDFENAEPTDKEMKIYNMVNATLEKGHQIMQDIEDYKGAQDLVRKAIQSQTYESEEEAFLGLIPCVRSIRSYFQFAKELEQILPPLLDQLSSQPDEKSSSTLADYQALAKQLANIFDFVLSFDQMRMARPILSNDFSYYKRLLGRFGKHPKIEVKEDEANTIAMFTALHIPMLTSIAKATSVAVNQNPFVCEALALMANSCLRTIKSNKFEEKTNLLCARAMTGAAVLYDHVDVLGVFHKNSPVNTKQLITCLKKQFPNEQALLNALQFSTKHFGDASTPAAITALFE